MTEPASLYALLEMRPGGPNEPHYPRRLVVRLAPDDIDVCQVEIDGDDVPVVTIGPGIDASRSAVQLDSPVHGARPPRTPGVYVVCIDPDITGQENVAWTFRDEDDADRVVRALEAVNGEGTAWYTLEPVALSLNDDDLHAYLDERGALSHLLEARAQ